MVPRFLRGQGLTAGLIAAVVAAYLHPPLGAEDGPLRSGFTAKLAVALIFLIQGLSLPTRRLVRSAGRIRFHLYCLACTYVVAPLLMLALAGVVDRWLPDNLVAGLLFLSVVPTTISSAVVLTSNAEGDTSSALFATAVSNLSGVILTPLLCIQLIELSYGATVEFWPVFLKLLLLVLVPLLLGQAVRPFIHEELASAAPAFKRMSNMLIVFIVYAAFCQSFATDAWSAVESADLVRLIPVALLFLAAFSTTVWVMATLAGGGPPLRVAAFFCGSQKTLAAGAPMAALIFANAVELSPSLIILPLMILHPLQLVLGSALVPQLLRYTRSGLAGA